MQVQWMAEWQRCRLRTDITKPIENAGSVQVSSVTALTDSPEEEQFH